MALESEGPGAEKPKGNSLLHPLKKPEGMQQQQQRLQNPNERTPPSSASSVVLSLRSVPGPPSADGGPGLGPWSPHRADKPRGRTELGRRTRRAR